MAVQDPILIAERHWRDHGWDAGPHFLASLSICRVNDRIGQDDEAALKPHHLTRTRHEALAVLYFSRNGEMPLGKLSEHLFVHPTSVTSTVDTLERLGLVGRAEHPTDRRTTMARITAAGRRAMEVSCEAMATAHSGLGALDVSEAERLFRILRKVRIDAGDFKPSERRRAAGSEALDDPVLVAEYNWETRGWVARPYFRTALSIYRTAELIRQSIEAAVRPSRITAVRYDALGLLYFADDGRLPMGKLGKGLVVHPTSITNIVDALEQGGLAKRVPHPTDRRATLAQITPKGRRAVVASNTTFAESRFGVGALTTADANAVYRILGKVRLTR